MVGHIDSKFCCDIIGKRSNIEKISLVPLLPHTNHETLPLIRTWWLQWNQGRDWRHVSLILNLEGKVVFNVDVVWQFSEEEET
jgi:hypothetical protein